MSHLLLILLLNMQMLNVPDCDEFYKKELDPYDINGKIIDKKIEDGLYVFLVEQKDESQKELRFLQNTTGMKIYLFAKKDATIVIRKKSRSVHLLVPMSYGYEGKIFENLCE